MAKLSAGGRHEVLRFQKVTVEGDETTTKTRALMSDGKILTKMTVVRPPTASWDDGKMAWNWKVHGTIKAGVTPLRWGALMVLCGWKKIHGKR